MYLGLPLSGTRLPAGGLDAFFALGYEDAVLKLYGPTVQQAVERRFEVSYQWSTESRALAAELDFVARERTTQASSSTRAAIRSTSGSMRSATAPTQSERVETGIDAQRIPLRSGRKLAGPACKRHINSVN